MHWKHEHVKNWIRKQEYKTCSTRDTCDIGQVKGVGDRVEVSEGQSCPRGGRPQLGHNRQHEAEMKRLALDSDRLEVKSWCCQPLAV